MPDPERSPVTLNTLHEDLAAGFGEMRAGFADLKDEMRAGFADLKTTLVGGFRSLPTRESSEEMVRLLREANRLHEEGDQGAGGTRPDRFTQLDARIREQHLEMQQVLRAVVEGQRLLIDGQRLLVEGQRTLSVDLKALIARIDALIRGWGDGNPPA
jgi:hypothetical protein